MELLLKFLAALYSLLSILLSFKIYIENIPKAL
ncbi:hypothetical protein T4A_7197 [Trichinella pseudospiralis]|uniref:Uncharacterized protein n=1 Tax=Trichinella pseudospiralis TaxID=6337 RepID=A0A0V1B7M4_TRIPS|nr:hypothetical protein T4A_7197 [Trichinella pseudospiralis]